MYLQAGRVDDAVATLEFAGPIAEHAACTDDVAVAVVAVQTLFAAGRSEAGDVASRLARRHPGVADFHILVAETAAARGDERLALDSLAELQHVGLPLLYRSFALALRRLETTAMRGYAHATDPGGVAAVHARLQELAPNVDVASRLLVVPTARLEQPNWTPSAVRRWVIRWVKLPLVRRFAKYRVAVEVRPTNQLERIFSMSSAGSPPSTKRVATAEAQQAGTPSRIALIAAGAALVIWLAFAVYLLTQSGANDAKWGRIVWVFASVEAVAFAAAGVLFGTTVNRQRAEVAEQQATANQRDAEGGRALAAALKADEPAVVQEGGAGGPQGLGVPGVPSGPGAGEAVDVATRHARLARQLFP